jgi:TonB family protein
MLAMVIAFCATLVRLAPESANSSRSAGALVTSAWNSVPNEAATSPPPPGLASIAPWLAPFWIIGVCFFYLRHAAGWISVFRLGQRGVCCAPEKWQELLGRFSTQLRLSRPIRLLESCLVDTPMVLGHFRPIILMPIGLLAGLPEEQLEGILLHELAHICRHDYLVNMLQRSVEGLLFYHPSVWWISRVLITERENCCDDAVVARTGNTTEYALALAALEQSRRPAGESALAVTGGNLVKRIRRLLYPKQPTGAWTPLLSSAILVVTTAAALIAWQAAPPPQKFAGARQPPEHAEPSPYELWLNEDVIYIISDAERVAFKSLTTDEEREKFIEQFWLRRDPSPGTSENEFKEEHYRRIAYANKHFQAEVPGWKTDRGRIYIIWGPPDEIDTHPGGDEGSRAPHEEWRYRHLKRTDDDVTFGFSDPLRNGEYGLTANPLNGLPVSLEDQAGLRPDRVRIAAKRQQPNLLTKVDPVYPALAMLSRLQGVVRLTIVIGKDGRVSEIEHVSGHPLLIGAASDAVRQWVYKPTLLNGKAFEVVTQVDVNFSLPQQ